MAQQYVVQSGDTLSAIGAKYGVNYNDIAQANGIANPNLIYSGQKITIPDGGGAPAPTQPSAPQQVQQPQQPSSAPGGNSGGGDTELEQLAKTDRNPVQETRYQELLKQQQSNGSSQSGAPTIDVNSVYNSAYNSPAIQSANQAILASQAAVDKINQGLSDAEAKINDNPYLSEATRVGRVNALRQNAAQDISNAQKDLALKQGNLTSLKSDAQNQVNIALKQYDINNQQHQEAVSQFNSLLSSGSLDYASSSDIASLSQSTGMSASMIQSAIKANQAKNQKSQVIPYNDGTEQGYVVINPDTGEILNKQVIAGAAPTKYNQGSSGGSSGSSVKEQSAQIALDKKQAPTLAKSDAQNKMTLGTMMSLYAPYMGKQQIYDIYNAVNYYHPSATQKKADQKRYGVK